MAAIFTFDPSSIESLAKVGVHVCYCNGGKETDPFAMKQDECAFGQKSLQEIERWQLRNRPKDTSANKHGRSAHLVFIDECGFMLAPLVRRTWAPRGHTPVIKVTEPHGRISTAGAITISPVRSRFGFYFQLMPDNANFRSHSIVAFVDCVRRHIQKPLIVIWDQIPIHMSYPVKRYEMLHKDVLFVPFPPYAPELNPVDYVWSYVKWSRLANYCPKNLVELRKTVTSELTRASKRPDLLESFFKATGETL